MACETPPSPAAASRGAPGLLGMATAFWISRALYVAAKLQIADVIGETSRAAEDVARSVGADADAIYRVLRALASVGVFTEGADGRFANTPSSELLKIDASGSLHGFIVMIGEKESWRAWEEILHSVRTGEPAFKKAFGRTLFEYLGETPDAARIFDQGMVSRGALDDEMVCRSFDFSGATEIVDVGGGRGSLLAAVLNAQPAARGTLFELRHVVDQARASFEPGLLSRCQFVGGDIFTDPLPRGADFYLLKKVVHDWSNDEARRILDACRSAMSDRSRLLVIEPVVPLGNEPSMAKLLDLFMLVWPGGRERTEGEHRQILMSAGLSLCRVIPTGSPISILEARRAQGGSG